MLLSFYLINNRQKKLPTITINIYPLSISLCILFINRLYLLNQVK